MRRAVLAVITLSVAVAGCSAPATPAAPSVGVPAASASDAASPAEASSAAIPAAPSASAAVPASATPTARASQATPATNFQVKDVEQLSGFYSPAIATSAGGMFCSVGPEGAECAFTSGAYKQLAGENECESWMVRSVWLATGIDYRCNGDPWVFPLKGDPSTGWVDGFGRFYSDSGQTKAILPYGKALRYAPYVCGMDTTGVTCSNDATGAGFHMNRAGLTVTDRGDQSPRAAARQTCVALTHLPRVSFASASEIIGNAEDAAIATAKRDAAYRPIADDLTIVREVGLHQLSDADRARSGAAWKRIGQACAALGVPNASYGH